MSSVERAVLGPQMVTMRSYRRDIYRALARRAGVRMNENRDLRPFFVVVVESSFIRSVGQLSRSRRLTWGAPGLGTQCTN